MVFSSTLFLFMFLPFTLLFYYFMDKNGKNIWLLFVSLIFFGWSQSNYLWIIILNIFINYLGAIQIVNSKSQIGKRIYFVISLILNLGLLFYFKYYNFVLDTSNCFFHTNFAVKQIILPIGISFFTFQGMSYLIDVYNNKVQVQKNILNVALYIMLFPQLVAGPIVRYTDINNEIESRDVNIDNFAQGTRKFIIGFSKKIIIANTMATIVDEIWSHGIQQNTVSIAWLGSIAYTLQIFFDFSGYSDMAIGLGKMFGFNFNQNFNLPYIAESISDFWRRWHISLSTWFRDYVYIPLGGNRKRVYLNLLIVFILTGIWHGASIHFIVWGLYNGLFILIERVFKKNNIILFKKHKMIGKVLKHIYTLFIINTGWLLFRADTTQHALDYFLTMFGIGLGNFQGFNIFWYLNRWTVFVLIIGIIISTSWSKNIAIFLKSKLNSIVFNLLRDISLIAIFLFAIMRMVSGTYNPFIYFQF